MPRSSDRTLHLLYEALRASGMDITDKEEILARLKTLERGLEAEDEFVALSLWMERCRLVHKLDQNSFPRGASYRVPDLLAVYDYGGDRAFLIEVKSTYLTDSSRLTSAKLEWSARYRNGLLAYAERVGCPLLIAWRLLPWDLWTLFDARLTRLVKTGYQISYFDAFRANLLGPLLGNIHIVFNERARLRVRIKKLTKRGAAPTKEFVGQVDQAGAVGADGQLQPELTQLIDLAWRVLPNDAEVEETDTHVTNDFVLHPESVGLIAHQLLGLRPRDHEDGPRAMLVDGKFPSKYSDLLQQAQRGIDLGVTRYAISILPDPWPDFLPRSPEEGPPS